ncbi:uncharacterized protein PFL1_00879 [Pseudozyma flocculosa PF-1]|uniref:Uncharacterized protein n=1 Tax=Pseudozyma flocculosa TaxID=84751 RepID=A0A5C3F409_9BASI|nr:uncharacterized protein PFL1_00879 [Pseudozyma flocculosa PF-1]EPQ31546.1 hypothetical protein PFL1_00879 [Pseudozyma flocculosa PF-1]SPO38666.1 uncharacterized protein PSFLO_04145 [Pseudozyma flocculosa]
MMSACETNGTAGLQAAPSLDESTATSSTLEPPDSDSKLSAALDRLDLGVSQAEDAKSRAAGLALCSSNSMTIQCHRPADAKAHYGSGSGMGHVSTSYGSRFARHPTLLAPASMESHSSFDTFCSVPPSPSMSEGLTDSPSSVSSMNSFRRGDLADIEDLDLEPELETVSECDEESSSLCSTDIVLDMDSDSERASNGGLDNDHGAGANLGRSGTLKALASGSPASDYARRKRSEWYLNSYANKIAARRPRKPKASRVAEIVEEGGGDIRTTVMPRPSFAGGSADWSCEMAGPPAPAPRSISPSDTVPSVPSPLCVCISADTSHGSGEAGGSTAMDDSVETVKALKLDGDATGKDGTSSEARDNSTFPQLDDTASEAAPRPPSPSSPPRGARARRDSSPARLRPCFRRRSSNQSAASTRESSCDRESVRGRSVRFSPAPPMEMRTHSPVEYDRKSCPINNKLSPEDVEELRTMKMEMGLLEAKWAADAACKAPPPESRADTNDVDRALSDAAHNAGIAALSAASHRGSIGAAETGPSGMAHMTTAARIRLQKEREREKERQKQLPRFNRPARSAQYDCDSVRAKFGQAPPPPLPGLPQPASRSASPRSSSAPPISRTPSEERAFRSLLTEPPTQLDRRTSVIPTLTQTAPSPPPSPLDVDHANKAGRDAWRRPSIGGPTTASLRVGGAGASTVESRGRAPGPASLPAATSRGGTVSSPSPSSPLRPANMPSSWTPPSSSPSPSPPSFPGPSSYGGYDSPVSCEFYESGSEYDLVG